MILPLKLDLAIVAVVSVGGSRLVKARVQGKGCEAKNLAQEAALVQVLKGVKIPCIDASPN